MDQDSEPVSPGGSQSVDTSGIEFISAENTAEEDDTVSIATVPEEDVGSGEEVDADEEEEKEEPSVVITDPFTRQDLVDQQKADDSLKPLFEAARRDTLCEMMCCMVRTCSPNLTRHHTR